ncbi:5-methylthioadenosine/S-adenosylhomocysteine deaminase [Porphyromonas crevioricanis]|uniref:5-methylthioadenosine/S-adenosylhomocysteine deaminase n=1 Tax=Porphyromonas crevioricanis TaxID=393921 RepID=A0A2X4PHB8_9PORP|nr:amidohydrolase [Porphyromonas crevioricanis]GAD06715.1 S-adenosylhomocysteine deaminase [Porphyromonas crevioricanis JCM 13913]SQH73316.1 5-methylthioadenosine/S-adenosylhomocysteine deaminase [Porphyromonas crevioricanis]
MKEQANKILIQGAILDGQATDLLIEDNRISRIAPKIESGVDMRLIDGSHKAIVPGMYNCHTHSAMTYFRGYGDDLNLMDWLEGYIWPVEAHLTPEDVYWGSKLACLEMIRSGTAAFLDMYTFPLSTAQAVEDMGLRAVLSYTLFDRDDPERAALDREQSYVYLEKFKAFSDRITFSIGPHAIYTVSGPQLQFCHRFAEENDVLIHLHLSETEGECRDAMEKYGLSPVRYLHKLGVLSPHLVLAHAVWVDEEEMDLLAKYGCKVVHNPASNLKLASGYQFRYEEMRRRGILIGLGTDGTSSSNNLDMYRAMHLAALMGKAWRKDPTAVTARDIYRTATADGAAIMGIDAGVIAEGKLADLCLVDLKKPEMVPCHNLVSNLVYSASGSAVVDTTIVDGRILMLHGKIEGEDEIIDKAAEVAYKLIAKARQAK